MRIIIYSHDKSKSLLMLSKLTSQNNNNFDITAISSLDEEQLDNIDNIDNISLLIIGNNILEIFKEVKNTGSKIKVLGIPDTYDTDESAELINKGLSDVIHPSAKLKEIISRINLIKRHALAVDDNFFEVGDLKIYLDGKNPEYKGKVLKLTKTEYLIFETLCKRIGNMVSKEALFNKIWSGKDNVPFDKNLDVHLHNLRKKVEKFTHNNISIDTISQRGYILELKNKK